MKLLNIRLAYAMGALALVMSTVAVSAKPVPKKQTTKKAKVVTPPASTTGATAATTTGGASTAGATTPVATGPFVTITNKFNEDVTVTLIPYQQGAVAGAATTERQKENMTLKYNETGKIRLKGQLVAMEVQTKSYETDLNKCQNTYAFCNAQAQRADPSDNSCDNNSVTCIKQAERKRYGLPNIIYPEDSSWIIEDEKNGVVINLKE